MTEYVTVKDSETGHHFTIPAGAVEALGDHLTVVAEGDEAVDRNGNPHPPKPHLPLGDDNPNVPAGRRGKAPEAANTEANKEAN